jgi:hypothetical protein
VAKVKLDWFTRIKSVHFGSENDNAVVTVEYATSQVSATAPPTITLSHLPWTTGSFDLGDAGGFHVTDHTTGKDLMLVPPPYKIVSEGDAAMRGIVFFYMESISRYVPVITHQPRVFEFHLAMPGTGGSHIVDTPVYWLWGSDFGATTLEENQAHPFTTGDPFNPPFGIMTLPRAFDSPGPRDTYLGLGVATWHGADRIDHVPVSDAGDWNAFVTSYSPKIRTTFPINSQDVPEWDTSVNSGYSQQVKVPQYAPSNDTVVAAMVVKFLVNLDTLAISSGRA